MAAFWGKTMIVACSNYNCEARIDRVYSIVKKNKNNFCCKKCKCEFEKYNNELEKTNLIGQKFGKLEVLEFDCINRWRSYKFKCKCSCGKIISMSNISLKKGDNPSCINCRGREYVGEVGGEYFSMIRNKAKKRNIPFEITKSDIWEKFLGQGRKCVYSGLELCWKNGSDGENGTASVDRKDSKIGYTKENIQIVHKHINKMKLDHSSEYFLQLCTLIHNHNQNKI